jgi:hypothetical protein
MHTPKQALGKDVASFEIPIQDLQFDKEIGRGAFGVVRDRAVVWCAVVTRVCAHQVYKGMWRDSPVAIKQLLLEETSGAVFERELKTFQVRARRRRCCCA